MKEPNTQHDLETGIFFPGWVNCAIILTFHETFYTVRDFFWKTLFTKINTSGNVSLNVSRYNYVFFVVVSVWVKG